MRDWLKELSPADRRIIGYDIGLVEFGWPIGMPLCRPLGGGLWEVRSSLSNGRIARVMFSSSDGLMILLHGFIKKTQRTPKPDLELARSSQKELDRNER